MFTDDYGNALKPTEVPSAHPIYSGVIVSIALSSFGFIFGGETIDTLLGIYDTCGAIVAFIVGAISWDEYTVRKRRYERYRRIIARRGLRFRKQKITIEPIGEKVIVERRMKLSSGEVDVQKRTFHAENESEEAYDFVRNLREGIAEPSASAEAVALAKGLKDFRR